MKDGGAAAACDPGDLARGKIAAYFWCALSSGLVIQEDTAVHLRNALVARTS